MKNSFANETNFLNPMEQDIERIRKQLGKGMEIGEIADKLHLDRGVRLVSVLVWNCMRKTDLTFRSFCDFFSKSKRWFCNRHPVSKDTRSK